MTGTPESQPRALSLRVAHVVLSMRTGGAERVVVDLVNCAGPGFGPFVICLETSGPMASELREPAPPVVTLQRRPGFRPWLALPLARVLRRSGAHLAHTHNSAAGFYGALGARLAGLPVLQTKHGQNLSGGNQRALNRFSYRLTQQVVAVSRPAYELARSEGVPVERLRIIDNGVDTTRFIDARLQRGRARRELGVAEENFVIGTLGRLVPEKNHRLLIESAGDLVSRQGHPAVLAIAGEGPERGALAAAAGAAPPGLRVVLAGIQRAETWLPALDVFVLSSHSEGLPIALLEAMACGVPALVTAVGAMPQVVDDGRAGLLVPPGDRGALARALGVFAVDAGKRLEVGSSGRARVRERYSADRMARDYEAVYEQLARSQRVAARRRERSAP